MFQMRLSVPEFHVERFAHPNDSDTPQLHLPWFGCWVVCVVVVLFFVFSGDTLIIVSPFLSYGRIANQTRCIDDRLVRVSFFFACAVRARSSNMLWVETS